MNAINKLKIVSGTLEMCNKLLAAFGNSLVVQWLGLCAFTAEGVGSAPGWGTKIPQAMWHCQKKPKKHYWLFSFF